MTCVVWWTNTDGSQLYAASILRAGEEIMFIQNHMKSQPDYTLLLLQEPQTLHNCGVTSARNCKNIYKWNHKLYVYKGADIYFS